MSRSTRVVVLMLLSLLASRRGAAEDPLLDLDLPKSKATKNSDLDDLLDSGNQGIPFRLVQASDPQKSIDKLVYWRTMPGAVAARVAPVALRLDDADLIAPLTKTDGAGAKTSEPSYPTFGRAPLKPGKHVLTPGPIGHH